jgi:hypothetical protein
VFAEPEIELPTSHPVFHLRWRACVVSVARPLLVRCHSRGSVGRACVSAAHWHYLYGGVPQKFFHLYLGELSFRFNHRNGDLSIGFEVVTGNARDKDQRYLSEFS